MRLSILRLYLFVLHVCLFFSLLPSSSAAGNSLANEFVSLIWDSSDLSLISFSSVPLQYEFLASPCTVWWQAQLVSNSTDDSPIITSASNAVSKSVKAASINSLIFRWQGISIPKHGQLDIAVTVQLLAGEHSASFYYDITSVNLTAPLGLWLWTWQINNLETRDRSTGEYDDVIIINDSYGLRWTRPLVSFSSPYSRTYPSAAASYQFLAYYHEQGDSNRLPPQYPGLYFATHDPSAATKVFAYTPDTNTHTIGLSVQLRPNNSNLALPQTAIPFPFNLGAFIGDWWDAAQVYRYEFALNTLWTSAGPLINRPDVPAWLLRNHVWINSGWSYVDIFNSTQGDPDVVLDRVTNIYKRFNLPQLALHWYVFQESNLFDVNYPVWFPVKPGFREVTYTM